VKRHAASSQILDVHPGRIHPGVMVENSDRELGGKCALRYVH
jgi:hypothetical protein